MQIPAWVTMTTQICCGCYEAIVDPPGSLCEACSRPQVGDMVIVEEPVSGREWLTGYVGDVTSVDSSGEVVTVDFIIPSKSGLYRCETVALGIEEVEVWRG
jgi:hypothetical protein